MDGRQLARGLGWFSIGLGLVQVLAPRRMSRRLGLHGRHRTVRSVGIREIGAGVGLLLGDGSKPGWVWGRVAGDVMDLGLLATARPRNERQRRSLAVAKAAIIGAAAVDMLCAERLRNETDGGQQALRQGRRPGDAAGSRATDVEEAVIVTAPAPMSSLGS